MATVAVRHRDVSNQGSELFGTPSSQVISMMESNYDHDNDNDNEEVEEENDDDSVELEPSTSFFVRALYDYASTDGSSMSFKQGAIIKVLSQEETGWWDGLLENDERGWFPSNYVEVITEEEADYILAQSEAAANLTPSSSSASDPNVNQLVADYSGLGLDQDFDNLRKLMTGASPMNGNDAFEQLAEEGVRSTYTLSEENTPTLNSTMAAAQNKSPYRRQQQQQPLPQQQRTVPMQQTPSSSSTTSSRLSGYGNGSISKLASASTSSLATSERQRAYTLAVASGSNSMAAPDNRPRASSEVRIGHSQRGAIEVEEDESDESIVKELRPSVTSITTQGRRSSTIYMQRSDRTLMARRNAIENMPDPRTIPFPWIAKTSEDDKSFFYYNRQTHETSNEVTLMPLDSRWDDSTEDLADVAVQGPRMIRSSTVNSSTASHREEEPSLTTYSDEKEAFELQGAIYTPTNSSLQLYLETANDAIEDLAIVASESIASDGMSDQDRIHIVEPSEEFNDTSRLGLAMYDVADCIRDVLYATGSLLIPQEDLANVAELNWLAHDDDASMDLLATLSSTMSAQQHPRTINGFTSAAPPSSLVSIGKRMNAILSKVVLSTRSVIEQSFLNSEVRPDLSSSQLERIYTYRMRIRDECMELSKTLNVFALEAENSRNAESWMKTVEGVFQSGKGNAGIGLELLGGGAAAGWRGNGFVLPSAMEAAALRAEANGTYQNPFELTKQARSALSSGKVVMRRKPTLKLTRERVDSLSMQFDDLDERLTQFARWIKQGEMTSARIPSLFQDAKEILSITGKVLTALEDFDFASSLDVDGPSSSNGKSNGYINIVKRSRELLYEIVSCKQEMYDMSSSMVMALQDVVGLAQLARDRNEWMPMKHLVDIVLALVSFTQSIKDILGELVNISEEQAKSKVGQVGLRSQVQGVDHFKLTLSKTGVSAASTPGEEKNILYLGPGLQLPDGPAPQSSSSNNKPMVDGNRTRSTSIAASAKSRESLGRTVRGGGDDDTESIKGMPRGNSKIKRFFGDDAPDMIASLEPEPKQVEEIPWFLEPDTSPDDIVLSPTGQVKGATLNAMMERLTMHNAFDSSFNTTFLMTYRSFTSTGELLDLLWARFCIKEPANLTPEELQIWTSRKQMLIRFRIFNVIKTWLESHFYEGQDEIHLNRLEQLVLEGMGRSPSLASPGKQLIRLIERRSGKGEKIVMTPHTPGHPPPPILPKNARKIKFLDIDPLEMARQLTLIDSRLYGKIKPVECLNKSWSRDNGAIIAKGIRDCISANNKVSGWVSEAILFQEDLKKRSAWVKQFLAIAEKCFKLNNYSTMMAIYSGLNNASLARLKRTWDAVNQRHLQMFERMKEILSPEKNFTQYRESLRRSTPPCVPFLGVYLTDLTFIEDGNSDKLKTDERLINFGKRQMTADKIEEIMNYQRLPYNLAEVTSIQQFIQDNLIDTRHDNELYEQSLKIEPREREDEKIARLLQESGFL